MGMRIFCVGWILVSLLGGSAGALGLATGNLAAFFLFAGCTVLLTGACAAVGGLFHMACGDEDDEPVPRPHRVRLDRLEVIEVETRP